MSMPSIRLALHSVLAISLAALTGQAPAEAAAGSSPRQPPAHAHEHPHAPAAVAHDHAHGAPTGMADVALRTVPERPRAGEPTELTFTLADGAGQPIRGLTTHHGRKLHVLIVSEDMEVFGHVHPQDFEDPVEDGEATVFFTFPRAGRY